MPKLSAEALKKRHKCHICGVTLRTRQGLSGHIRFKHPSGHEQPLFSIEEAAQWLERARIFGVSEQDIKELKDVIAWWAMLEYVFSTQPIKLDKTDFKNFLLTCVAIMRAKRYTGH